MGPYTGIKLLGAGASLRTGESLVSPSGNARFTVQPDGNAVVYQVQPDGTEKCLFATHTHAGNPAALGQGAAFVIQEDDNAVLYDTAGKPVWATNTVEKGVGRVTLALGDNGVLVLVDEADPPTAVWNSGPRGELRKEWGGGGRGGGGGTGTRPVWRRPLWAAAAAAMRGRAGPTTPVSSLKTSLPLSTQHSHAPSHPHCSLVPSPPTGIKAAFESLSAGATYLAERGTYYASDAYDKSKVVAAKTLDQAKAYGATAVEEAKVFGEKVKSQSADAYATASEKAGQALEVAKEKAAVVADKAQDVAGKVVDKANEAYAAARK